jgi:hypothetical protein
MIPATGARRGFICSILRSLALRFHVLRQLILQYTSIDVGAFCVVPARTGTMKTTNLPPADW